MKYLTLTGLTVLLLLSGLVPAEALTGSRLTKITIPAYDWPPFNILEKDGTWSGADVEITREVLRNMGYEAVLIARPFKRILIEMKAGKHMAMLPCVEGGGREDYMLFSDPVSSIYSVLWKQKSDHQCWSSYEDLKGRVIGASPYHYGAGFFEAADQGKFTVQVVSSQSPEMIHFSKLIKKRVDMVICERSVGLYLKAKHAPRFDAIDYCEKGVGPARPFSFPVSRAYFHGRESEMHAFIEQFNRELKIYSDEGKRQAVFNKYHMNVELDFDDWVETEHKEDQ